MLEIKVKTKKWGNSIGIIIPKEVIRQQNIKPDQEITLMLTKKPITKGRDIWGTLKFKEPADQLMREVDREFGLD